MVIFQLIYKCDERVALCYQTRLQRMRDGESRMRAVLGFPPGAADLNISVGSAVGSRYRSGAC